MHALQEIAESGSLPLTKTDPATTGRDAKMGAALLVASVMAAIRATDKQWHGFAVQIIRGTTDFRAEFIGQMKKHVSDMRRDNAEAIANLGKDGKPDPTKSETKLAGKRVSTATNYAARLSTIANAFNGGATEEGLLVHAQETGRVTKTDLDSIGFTVIYEYAQKFSNATAGRKKDLFIVKLSKWLDKNPAEDGDKSGEELHNTITKMVAEYLAKQQAK